MSNVLFTAISYQTYTSCGVIEHNVPLNNLRFQLDRKSPRRIKGILSYYFLHCKLLFILVQLQFCNRLDP